MSVVEPRPNPETVEALLDITWHVAASKTERTAALDRKATTVASIAAVLATLTATLGVTFVERLGTVWSFALFVTGVATLLAPVALAVAALEPKEYVTIGAKQLEAFSTWSTIRESPEDVRGAAMRTIIVAVSRERRANARKTRVTRIALRLVVAALILIGGEAVIRATGQLGR